VEGWPSAAIVFTLDLDRQRISCIAHSHHPISAPIFGVTVKRLLRQADRQPAARVLDLGCGEGAWALRVLAHYLDRHADSVDVSPYATAPGSLDERHAGDLWYPGDKVWDWNG
jgi:SAM-dependent methyltransferase